MEIAIKTKGKKHITVIILREFKMALFIDIVNPWCLIKMGGYRIADQRRGKHIDTIMYQRTG